MGVHEPHLVAISLGHSCDQVVDMADGGPDGGRCLPGSEPRIHLQLSAALQHLEVEVQVLEVACEHSSRPCNPNLLGLDLDLDPRREVHSLRWQDGLHCDGASEQTSGNAERWRNQTIRTTRRAVRQARAERDLPLRGRPPSGQPPARVTRLQDPGAGFFMIFSHPRVSMDGLDGHPSIRNGLGHGFDPGRGANTR